MCSIAPPQPQHTMPTRRFCPTATAAPAPPLQPSPRLHHRALPPRPPFRNPQHHDSAVRPLPRTLPMALLLLLLLLVVIVVLRLPAPRWCKPQSRPRASARRYGPHPPPLPPFAPPAVRPYGCGAPCPSFVFHRPRRCAVVPRVPDPVPPPPPRAPAACPWLRPWLCSWWCCCCW